MKINVQPHGKLASGEEVLLFRLENDNGMVAEISTLGGAVTKLLVPDRSGRADDVVLGHDALEGYAANKAYFGALVGRSSNRIAGAKLAIGDSVWELEKNDGEGNLHGGSNGLSFRVFSGEARMLSGSAVVMLSHTMEHKSDGFPGNLTVTVAYALTAENALMIDYRAISDDDTVINLTNHSYFNLAGHDSGTIHSQTIQLEADYYCPGYPDGIPTGEILSVEGTPFDLRAAKTFGECFRCDCDQLRQYGGFDHNFVLSGGSEYRRIATVCDPASGRIMDVFTDMPGVQLYTANMLASGVYKSGAVYKKHQAFCLETQLFPNAVHMPWLASPIFRAGEEFATTTTYQFR